MAHCFRIYNIELASNTTSKSKVLDNSKIKEGDVVIALASSGVHSNGFSLVRKVFDVREDNEKLTEYNEFLGDSLVNTLLTPTKIYVKSALKLIEECDVRAISHITGGGFYENIPRMLPENLKAVVKKDSFEILPIFKLLQETGNIPERDMFNTFNMGIGMIAAVPQCDAEKAVKVLTEMGEKAYIIGTVEEGENGVELI